jgi:hypothetical protein
VSETNPFDGLLVLCPTLGGLEYETEVSLDGLVRLGAGKLRSSGNSCVAMHRSQIAGAAERRILQEPGAYSTVMWLDGDMVANPTWVRELVELVTLVAKCRPKPFGDHPETMAAKAWNDEDLERWRRTNAPALVGAYVKRNAPQHLALRRVVPPAPPLSVSVDRGDGDVRKYELEAIVSGMGCMVQTVEAFLEHIKESPLIEHAGEHTFPAICGSGPAKAEDGSVAWASEDWMYTSWEWQMGRGVYLVRHALFGHVGKVTHWPAADSLLDG